MGKEGIFMKTLFYPKDVEKLVDITYRQIQYWDRSKLVKPSLLRKDRYRLYSLTDLIQLDLVVKLRNKGISIQKMRKIVTKLKKCLSVNTLTMSEIQIAVSPKGSIIVSKSTILMDDEAAEDHFFYNPKKFIDLVNDYYIKKATQKTLDSLGKN